MVMLPAAPPTISRAARRPEAASARCQPNPLPSSYLPPFWPSGVQSVVERAAKLSPGTRCSCQSPGLFQIRFGCHDATRGAEAMLQRRVGEIPGVRAGGAKAAILDIEQVPRVDLSTAGDTEASGRRHREQPVQFNRDAGGAECNVPDARAGGGPGQFDQDADGAHGCASPDTAADAGEAASRFFTVSIVRLG